MKVLKKTIEIATGSENEAKELIETYRQESKEKKYVISSVGYTYKTKKAKGEIIGEAYVVKVVQIFNGLWEEFE